jgi:hypothetical protein
MADACSPSYSGGRDQHITVQSQPQANSMRDPISKIPITRKGLAEWLKEKALSLCLVPQKRRKKFAFHLLNIFILMGYKWIF